MGIASYTTSEMLLMSAYLLVGQNGQQLNGLVTGRTPFPHLGMAQKISYIQTHVQKDTMI